MAARPARVPPAKKKGPSRGTGHEPTGGCRERRLVPLPDHTLIAPARMAVEMVQRVMRQGLGDHGSNVIGVPRAGQPRGPTRATEGAAAGGV